VIATRLGKEEKGSAGSHSSSRRKSGSVYQLAGAVRLSSSADSLLNRSTSVISPSDDPSRAPDLAVLANRAGKPRTAAALQALLAPAWGWSLLRIIYHPT